MPVQGLMLIEQTLIELGRKLIAALVILVFIGIASVLTWGPLFLIFRCFLDHKKGANPQQPAEDSDD